MILLFISAFCFQLTVLLSKFKEGEEDIEQARKDVIEKETKDMAVMRERIDQKLKKMSTTVQFIYEQYNGGNTIVRDNGHLDTAYNGCTVQQTGQKKRRADDADDVAFEEVKDEDTGGTAEPEVAEKPAITEKPVAKEKPEVKERPEVKTYRVGCPKMPGVIATAEAKKYWRKLRAAGFVDDEFKMLRCNRQQAMYIALFMSDKLRLRYKWKPFEDWWGIRKLAQERCKMEKTGVLPLRAKEIMDIFN